MIRNRPTICAHISRLTSCAHVARVLGIPGKRVVDWMRAGRVPEVYHAAILAIPLPRPQRKKLPPLSTVPEHLREDERLRRAEVRNAGRRTGKPVGRPITKHTKRAKKWREQKRRQIPPLSAFPEHRREILRRRRAELRNAAMRRREEKLRQDQLLALEKKP